jgi:hypothetical protein
MANTLKISYNARFSDAEYFNCCADRPLVLSMRQAARQNDTSTLARLNRTRKPLT